MFALTRN